MRLRGSSGTDEHQPYVDDGLQRKYEGLHQMRLALNRQDFPPEALLLQCGGGLASSPST